MSRPHTNFIANDNQPPASQARGDAVGFHAIFQENLARRVMPPLPRIQPLHNRQPSQGHTMETSARTKRTFDPSLIAAILALAFFAVSTRINPSALVTLLSLASVTGSALWLVYTASRKPNARLAKLAVLIAMISGLGLWFAISLQFDHALNLVDGMIIFALCALLCASFYAQK